MSTETTERRFPEGSFPLRRAVLNLALSLCLVSPALAQPASSDPLSGLPFEPFRWLPIEGGPERGALLVPIELAGKTYQFQLDTGADGTILYGMEAERWGWKKGERDVRV